MGNRVLIDAEPIAVDAIEFDSALRCSDVASDVAFAWLDLLIFDRPRRAARFVDVDQKNRGGDAALSTPRWDGAYRALLRVLLAALQVQLSGLAPASDDAADRTPRLRTDVPPQALAAHCAALAATLVADPA
ncbi:MAG: hypothetical protein RMK97_02640 [Sutterellaceae bacterium]|nr:hypothetical protein [Burkholderiaceae bacterium]MDW8429392.1 hypothetical protein [Sutterellaceae bacterium]